MSAICLYPRKSFMWKSLPCFTGMVAAKVPAFSLFGINLTDADAISNQSIIKSEETLYLNELPTTPSPCPT